MIATVLLLITAQITFALLNNGELPCDFLDSINISNGTQYPDGSMVHDDVRYALSNYAWIDYDFTEDGSKIPVKPYARGCVCQVKNCLWLCCPESLILYGEQYPTCSLFNESSELFVKMESGSGSIGTIDLMAQQSFFKALRSEQCEDLTYAHSDEWNMNGNGHVNSLHSVTIRQHEYCLLPSLNNETELYYCPQKVVRGEKITTSLSYSSIIGQFSAGVNVLNHGDDEEHWLAGFHIICRRNGGRRYPQHQLGDSFPSLSMRAPRLQKQNHSAEDRSSHYRIGGQLGRVCSHACLRVERMVRDDHRCSKEEVEVEKFQNRPVSLQKPNRAACCYSL